MLSDKLEDDPGERRKLGIEGGSEDEEEGQEAKGRSRQANAEEAAEEGMGPERAVVRVI